MKAIVYTKYGPPDVRTGCGCTVGGDDRFTGLARRWKNPTGEKGVDQRRIGLCRNICRADRQSLRHVITD